MLRHSDALTILTSNFIIDDRFFSSHFSYHTCLSAILQFSNEAMLLLNHEFLCIGCNQQFLKLSNNDINLNLQNDKQILTSLYQKQADFFSQLTNQLHSIDSFNNILFHLLRDNEKIFVNVSVNFCQISANENLYFVRLSPIEQQDILSVYPNKPVIDPLTQLQSKPAFFDFAHDFFQDIQTLKHGCVALIRLHIDKLHTFNASIGRNATDKLIILFTKRLQNFYMSRCEIFTFSRLGGSDFAILIGTPNEDILYEYLYQLHDLSEQAFLINESHMYVNFSSGVALYYPHIHTFDRLLHRAEKALKQALFSGGNTSVWFDELDTNPVFSNIHLSSSFTHAMRESQVIAYFQPKVAFHQRTFAFEALVRWQHPVLGLLSPKDFLDEVLDISSQSLFENVVKYCLLQIADWKAQGFLVKVAINVDVRQLWHRDFLLFIESCVLNYPDFCEHIEFEITETAQIQHHEKTLTVLKRLKDFGIKLAIDDFGTGFASLSYLLDYPIDKIKLDKVFIANIIDNQRHLQLVKSVIELAHQLDLEVIAEGVETLEQLALLKSIGCDVTQGYLHGKPMSSKDVRTWLKNL